MLELTIRLIASLAVVLGLLLLLAKLAGRKFRTTPGATVRVLHRQPLTRASAVSVVGIGSRILVIGSTDQQVNLIAELDPDELDWVPEVELAGVHEFRQDPPELPAQAWLEDTADASAHSTRRKRALNPPQARTRPAASAHSTEGSGVRRGGSHRAEPDAARTSGSRPLDGSLLSTHTWRQAFAAATRRAS